MKVAVAEDGALMREGIVAILERGGHEVPWCARDATELDARLDADALAEALPDVLVVDVRMPPGHGDDGLRSACRLRSTHPDVGVLVLSQHLANAYARELLATAPDGRGGTGYLLKERVGRIEEFLDAVDEVGSGGVRLDPKVVAHLLREPEPPALGRLAPRELQVLALIAEGRTNAQIAEQLHLGRATVERHVSAVFTTLGLDARDGNRRVLAVLEVVRAGRAWA